MKQKLDPIAAYLAYAGLFLAFAAVIIWLINRRFDFVVAIPLFSGLLLVILYVIIRPAEVRGALSGRQARYGGNAILMIVAFIGILLFVNYLSNRYHTRWDVTEEKAYSLSPQTIQILKGLKEPVTITGFLVSADPRRGRLGDLLDEYQFYTDKVTYEFIDPDMKPALAKQYDISTPGILVLERGDKRQETYAVDEQDLTSAILKVSRDEEKTVYFVTGHKEHDPAASDEKGYSLIASDLEGDNYRVGTLNLSAITDEVPADAAALIVAGSHVTFTEQERNLFIDYLYNGGKVMMMFDPGVNVADLYIMSDWGIRVRNDLVIDPASSFFGDIATPMVNRYPAHLITKDMGGLTTSFAYARSLELLQPAPPNMRVMPLVLTSERSWGETKITRDMQVLYDEQEDTLGPLTIGVAIDETARGGRMVVFGDSDFVANGMLTSVGGAFGNADLFMNAVNWLTEDEDLIAISPKQVADRQVILTGPQKRLIFYSSVILLPLVILAVGAATWWANR